MKFIKSRDKYNIYFRTEDCQLQSFAYFVTYDH